MNLTKKLLVFGDREEAPYHPISIVNKSLKSILGDEFILEFTDNYMELGIRQLQGYDAVISYSDCWNKRIKTEFVAALNMYVINGGAMMIIHNGISLQNNYELAQLIGAKFLSHPDHATLRYTDFNYDHPIMKDISEFDLFEEPYQFEFDSFTEKTVLFHYLYEDKKFIVAWTHDFGFGKIVYLSPGHDESTFENDNYQKIIQNSARWLIN